MGIQQPPLWREGCRPDHLLSLMVVQSVSGSSDKEYQSSDFQVNGNPH
jgi:hypothetical protein